MLRLLVQTCTYVHDRNNVAEPLHANLERAQCILQPRREQGVPSLPLVRDRTVALHPGGVAVGIQVGTVCHQPERVVEGSNADPIKL